MTCIYNLATGIPLDLPRPTAGLHLAYSHHAVQKARELLGDLRTLPLRLPHQHTVVEVTTEHGAVTKWVVRVPLDRRVLGYFHDLVLVVGIEGYVRTLWLNAADDNHATLRTSRLTRGTAA